MTHGLNPAPKSRAASRLPTDNQSSKRTGGKPIRLSKDTQQEESKNNSRNKRRIKKLFVECGDSITIGDKNGQLIDLKIMDKNNPFIGRIRFEVVTIKNEKYTIWKIRKKK